MSHARAIPFSVPKPTAFARPWRPSVSPATLNIAVALFIMAADNRTFWRRGIVIFDESALSLMMFGGAVWALTLFLLTLFGFRWLQKPVAIFLLLLSGATSYFMDAFGVMIDRDMIQNAMTTTINESKQLMTPDLILHVLLWGVAPAAIVLWVKVRPSSVWRNLLGWAGVSLASLALFAGLVAVDFKTVSAVVREHKELLGSYQPGAPLGGGVQYAKMMMKSRDVTVAPLGRDAVKGPLLLGAGKPMLAVLVVGETARAQNFGLDGYARDTTPELAARDVINFSNVSSCGTATAVSMPCMFSALGRKRYSYKRGIGSENLLDVLSHAGVKVKWWDNNTGDKGIANRVESAAVTTLVPPCDGECTDEVFLDLVRREMAEMTEDTVLVLHQIGSHGPAYHLRYPKDREWFAPACHSTEFADCTGEEIVNAYDNSIVYTDHVLASTIDLLAGQDRVIPALLYVSDHGESLGENGLYLHGAPYFMAPSTQTQVPMVMWLSEAYAAAFDVDTACLRDQAKLPASHDNLFSSVLGLMDIRTEAEGVGADLISPLSEARVLSEPRPDRITGFLHLLAAGSYSAGGLRRLWKETAFRQEMLGGAAALALLLWTRASAPELLCFAVLFLALIAVEALNTAVEVIVDHLSPEWSAMARDAKNLGSLAVLCLLGANGLYLAAVLLS